MTILSQSQPNRTDELQVVKGENPDMEIQAGQEEVSVWSSAPMIMAYRLLIVAAFLFVWQYGSVLPDYAISRPTDIWTELQVYVRSEAGRTDFRATFTAVVVGYVLGALIGSVVGVLAGSVKTLGKTIEPLVAAVNAVPKIALAPVFVMMFGLGLQSKIVVAIWGTAFVMFWNMYIGLRLVRPELVDVLKVLGGSRRHVLGYVTVPSLVPPFFTGLKAGLPLSILGVIAGEFIGSFHGLGRKLFDDSARLNSAGVWAVIVLLVAISVILNGLLAYLDRAVMRRLGMTR